MGVGGAETGNDKGEVEIERELERETDISDTVNSFIIVSA